nr:MFS transporter [uncultured Brevundimonas sp.]
MTHPVQSPPAPAAPSPLIGGVGWTVGVLMLFYAFAFLDRQILTLMVGPIRADLGISDFEISLLQGFAFAAFYAVFGLPVGWAVDRWSRRSIIFIGFVIWSLATASCGLARNFETIFLSRLLVGAGEAALLPAAFSILTDRVAPGRLAFNMSLFAIGAPIGAGASILMGGIVIQAMPAGGFVLPILGTLAPWQATFILVGAVGIPLACLAYTFSEPVRRTVASETASRWIDVLRNLAQNGRLYGGHFLGFSLMSLSIYGALIWMPAYLSRRFGMEPVEIGVSLALITAVPTIVGGLALGWIVDRWFRSGRKDAHLRFFAIVGPIQALLICAAMAAPGKLACLVLFAASQLGASFGGIAAAALQMVTPSHFRGRTTAIYLLVFNLIGYGLGASMVAAFTDFLFRSDEMVGWSIALTCLIFMPIASVALLFAGPRMARKLAADEAS